MIPVCILSIEDESDREFMTRIYLQYENLMYATVLKYVKNQAQAEDIVHTVVVKLIEKVNTLRGLERDNLVNYIITACKNTTFNTFRRKDREISWDFDDRRGFNGDYTAIEEFLIRREDTQRLSRLWDELDERTRYVLEARYFLDKEIAEIAADLGIKADSARMALTRARRKAIELARQQEEACK